MNLFDWYQFKLFIEHASGISMDAIHILVGFGIFLIVARLLRTSVVHPLPWTVLLVLELGNEAYDLKIELWPNLASQIGEGGKDVMLTMVLPTLVALIAKCMPGLFAPCRPEVSLTDDHMPGRP